MSTEESEREFKEAFSETLKEHNMWPTHYCETSDDVPCNCI